MKKKRLSVLVSLLIALFFLLSAVGAEDIVCNDSNANHISLNEEQPLGNLNDDNDSGCHSLSVESDCNGLSVENSRNIGSDLNLDDSKNVLAASNNNGSIDSIGESEGSAIVGVANSIGESDVLNVESMDVSIGESDSSVVNASANSTDRINGSVIKDSNVPYRFSSATNKVSTFGKKITFSLRVLNKEGKPINHTSVAFRVGGKTYRVYTNEKGICSINFKLNAGRYTIKYVAKNISGKNIITVRNYFRITNFKWKSGANVLKNKKIKSNVPDSPLVRKMIKLAKSGTPVIKFKGGNGGTVFITAGVHGNEIPSQIAALKLIKYLQTHRINGTVYVMPFMNPKGTAANVRDYKGFRLNKNANKKGSISYKTVKLIKKLKCDAYGDFHSTRSGGKPGKDSVFASKKPTKESVTIAKYISKYAKVKSIIYKKAGVEYPGAMEDEVNIKGIPSVTCEVISPHGKIKKGSAKKSLLMMKTLLRYHKII